MQLIRNILQSVSILHMSRFYPFIAGCVILFFLLQKNLPECRSAGESLCPWDFPNFSGLAQSALDISYKI
jgi:hypothetical protein